jgi:hypothetical protein
VIFPSSEVTDVALIAQLEHPSFARVHHRVVKADRKKDNLPALSLFGKRLTSRAIAGKPRSNAGAAEAIDRQHRTNHHNGTLQGSRRLPP